MPAPSIFFYDFTCCSLAVNDVANNHPKEIEENQHKNNHNKYFA